MAQEVKLMGATYSDVPSVMLPDANDTLHQFTDVSDTTAEAADVVAPKTFYNSAGQRTVGTGTGGAVSHRDADNRGGCQSDRAEHQIGRFDL